MNGQPKTQYVRSGDIFIAYQVAGSGPTDLVLPTLEQRMDDVRVVMDAAGSERAALFGISDGGPMSLLFAATYPTGRIEPAFGPACRELVRQA